MTVAFLALPHLVFTVGWLRPAVAVVVLPALAVAAVALARTRRAPATEPGEAPPAVSLGALLVALVPISAVILASGAGGLGPRTWDWLKHDAVLNDLIIHQWPVRYATEAGTTGLVYYAAFYLPAAVVGKIAGWSGANLVLLATSLTGALLAVLWLVVLVRSAPLLCGVLFPLFSGMDVLGRVLVGPWPPHLATILADYHLEWWLPLWQYSSTPSLLNFVPNQALAGWLLTALIVDTLRRGDRDPPAIALLAIALLWSPFVAIGLAPLLVAGAVARGGRPAAWVRRQLTSTNAAALLPFTVLVLYFASRVLPLPLPPRYHPATTPVARGDLWLVPAHEPLGAFLAGYVAFVACEFAVLWVLLLWESRADPDSRTAVPLLHAAGATLLVLPLFHFGLYNDLVMRASIPALFVLLIVAARSLRHGVRNVATLLIAVVLSVGALHAASLVRYHLGAIVRAGGRPAVVPQRSVRNLFQIQLYDPAAKRKEFVVQYLGSVESLFFSRLARPSPALDATAPDPLEATAGGRR